MNRLKGRAFSCDILTFENVVYSRSKYRPIEWLVTLFPSF